MLKIEIKDYSREEKKHIMKEYLSSKVASALDRSILSIEDSVYDYLLDNIKQSGVR